MTHTEIIPTIVSAAGILHIYEVNGEKFKECWLQKINSTGMIGNQVGETARQIQECFVLYFNNNQYVITTIIVINVKQSAKNSLSMSSGRASTILQ